MRFLTPVNPTNHRSGNRRGLYQEFPSTYPTFSGHSTAGLVTRVLMNGKLAGGFNAFFIIRYGMVIA